MAKVQVKISINKLDANHADYSSNLKELCVQAVVSGAKVSSDTDYAYYIIDSKNLPMSLAQGVVSLGAEISNYPFFIKMNPNDSVPGGIPNRSYEDENGNTVILDWINWKSANFEIHTLTDGNTYIAGEANTGDSVVFNDFSAVFANCIDAETFKSLLPVE